MAPRCRAAHTEVYAVWLTRRAAFSLQSTRQAAASLGDRACVGIREASGLGYPRSPGSVVAPGPSQECGLANAGPIAPSAIVHSQMATNQERMAVSLICSIALSTLRVGLASAGRSANVRGLPEQIKSWDVCRVAASYPEPAGLLHPHMRHPLSGLWGRRSDGLPCSSAVVSPPQLSLCGTAAAPPPWRIGP